jgi:hypothetical protein
MTRCIGPSNSSNKPILLDGLLTNPQPIVQAIREAGPSRGAKVPHVARTAAQTQVSWSPQFGITRSAHETS